MVKGRRARAIGVAAMATLAAGAASAAARVEAQPAWDGAGTVVAVVGTGVDYTHAALGGAGDAEAYAANDPTRIEPGSFPNAVVVGGTDLAGEAYTSDCPAPVPADVACAAAPSPDDDPLDLAGGTGTVVAGLVRAAAPGARIVALKTMGDPTNAPRRSSLQAAAADWILRHNRGEVVPGAPADGAPIDVVVFDAGRPWGVDATALDAAFAALAEAGVTVVAPASDAGDRPFILGETAAARHALAVSAVYGADEVARGIHTAWRAADGTTGAADHEAIFGSGPPRLADVGPITAPLAWHGLACNVDGAPPAPAQDVNERIALVERGQCTFVEKLSNALAAGAVAVLMFTDQRGKSNPGCGGDCPEPARIPAVMIDRPDGLALRARLEAGDEVTATLDAEYTFAKRWLADTLIEGAARGPAPQGAPKPDVAALGVVADAPVAGAGRGTARRAGSDVAGARAAALAARLRQRARAEGLELDGADVAAWIASHAASTVHEGRNDSGPLAAVSRQGAGRVDESALLGRALVRPDEGGTGIGFGLLAVAAPETRVSRTLTVRNLAPIPRAFDLAFARRPGGSEAGELSWTPERVQVAAHATATLTVTLTVAAADLPERASPDGRALTDASWLESGAIEGWLELSESARGTERLGVPIQALPRRAACVAVDGATAFDPSYGRPLALTWTNPCAGAGIVRLARHIASDPAESRGGAGEVPAALDVTDVGLRYGPGDPTTPGAPDVLEFHLATAGPRALPAGARFDLWIDRDRDGAWDRVVTGVHGPDARGGYAQGEWVALTVLPWDDGQPDLSGPHPAIHGVAYDLDERVTVLRLDAEALVFDPASGDEGFDFGVVAHRTLSAAPWPAARADLVPDDLLVGGRLSFDQRAAECLVPTLEGGGPMAPAGLDVPLPPGGVVRARIARAPGCAAADLGSSGFLASYPTNHPAAPAGQFERLRFDLVIDRFGTLYLPWAAREDAP